MWLSKENLSKLKEIKTDNGKRVNIWFSKEKEKEITAGCNGVPFGSSIPSLGIFFKEHSLFGYSFIVVEHF